MRANQRSNEQHSACVSLWSLMVCTLVPVSPTHIPSIGPQAISHADQFPSMHLGTFCYLMMHLSLGASSTLLKTQLAIFQVLISLQADYNL